MGHVFFNPFSLSMGTWPVQAKLDFPMWMSEFLANNAKEGSNCFTKFNLSFGAGDYSQHIDTEDFNCQGTRDLSAFVGDAEDSLFDFV